MATPKHKHKRMKAKNRKTKSFLEFDEKARADYLKGFQKRKNERRKEAREKHDRRVIAERKELLKQVRDTKKNHLRQQSVFVPEIENLVEPEVFDLPEHTVTISNIGDVDFVGNSGIRLGQNTGQMRNRPSELEDGEGEDRTPGEASKPVKNKSLRQQLAACTSQLSSQMMKAKKSRKKNMLRKKFHAQKKGTKKRK